MCYFIAAFILFLDQVSKLCIQNYILQGSSIPIIRDIFHLTLVHNTGAAFGMLGRHSYLFIIVSIFAIAVINYFLLQKDRILNAVEKVALCFIMGGTLGNLIDRVRLGYVVDFLDFRIWPVFNLADSFITIGAFMLAWAILRAARVKRVG